jgi:hypothetical protein
VQKDKLQSLMGVGGGGLFIVSQPKLGKQKFGTFLNENLLKVK